MHNKKGTNFPQISSSCSVWLGWVDFSSEGVDLFLGGGRGWVWQIFKGIVSLFSAVHGAHGCIIFHFQRSQCVLPHVHCAGLPGNVLQSWYKVPQLSWISDFYHWRWLIGRIYQRGKGYSSKRYAAHVNTVLLFLFNTRYYRLWSSRCNRYFYKALYHRHKSLKKEASSTDSKCRAYVSRLWFVNQSSLSAFVVH